MTVRTRALATLCAASLLAFTAAPHAQQRPDRSKPPAIGPAPQLSLPAIQKRTLSNGLQVWIVEAHEDAIRPALEFDRYGELKQAVADAVVATISPLRERYLELARDPGYVRSVLRSGAQRAHKLARERVQAAKEAIGLLGE